jgi:hypothetical protein
MGAAKNKAIRTAKAIEAVPESFRDDIFTNGRVSPRFDVNVLNDIPLLLGYLIATDDLEEDDMSDCSEDDVEFWQGLHDEGLTLDDLVTTWSKSLMNEVDAEEEYREGTKFHGYERDFLVASFTDGIPLTGKVDDRIADYLQARELLWYWNATRVSGDDVDNVSVYRRRLLRLKDAHFAGATLHHVGMGVATIVHDIED